jgi:hypothetical protein
MILLQFLILISILILIGSSGPASELIKIRIKITIKNRR